MQSISANSYQFDEFTLDLRRGCLLNRGAEEVRLRPKAFATLKYLVTNHGRLISKDELIDAVWPGVAVTDNSLVQCLKEVREALGDKSQRYIKTVPRRGYVFANLNESARPLALECIEDVEGIRVVIDEDVEAIVDHGQMDHRLISNRRTRIWTLGGKVFLLSLVALSLGFGAFQFLFSAKPAARPQKIAVLPFRSLNHDENDKFLGLGIADTLITRLGRTKELIVRPTSSIQKYATSDHDSIAAGREQQVDAVLEGSIQKSGEKVRITVRLISVADGSTLWSYKSDENFADVFIVEDSVSEKLANALALNLTGTDKQLLAKHYTVNSEAYQFYAKGVFLRNQMTQEALQKSVECFQKAIELDPNYALAYAGQASSLSPLAFFGSISISEAESRNKALIAKALELDDTLPEAHAALAEFRTFIQWDWEGAEQEFKRALELNPNEPLSHLLYPDVLLILGRPDEAIALSRAGFDLDPLSPRTGKALAHTYYYAGKYDQALDQSEKTLELFPDHRWIFLGPIYQQKGMYDQAIDGYLQSEKRWGTSSSDIAALRRAYESSGWRGFWQKRLDLAKVATKQKPLPPAFLAGLYARVDDKDKAFEWLEKAYDNRDMSLIFLKLDPVWQNLRADPRFANLLQRLRLAS